jgi:hypothetical protein
MKLMQLEHKIKRNIPNIYQKLNSIHRSKIIRDPNPRWLGVRGTIVSLLWFKWS